MKRDISLLRQVLLDVEAEATSAVAEQDPDLYGGHMRLAREAGWVVREPGAEGNQVFTLFLSNAGYDALAYMRDDVIFRAAVAHARSMTDDPPVQEVLNFCRHRFKEDRKSAAITKIGTA